MGLLDDISKGLKKGLDLAKEKGELGAKIAQLRLELVSLGRERDGLYTRLGKTYFTNPDDKARLEPVIAELQRVLGEVRKREEALDKLGEKPDEPEEHTPSHAVATPATPTTPTPPSTTPTATPTAPSESDPKPQS
jgi:hypothetical protein